MLDLFIRAIRLIDPFSSRDEVTSLLIINGRIEAIGKDIDAPSAVNNVIDGKGLWLTPGLMDIHCHLREPGEEYKEDIASGTMSAVAGGFTTICPMPNTRPPNDCASITRFIIEKGESYKRARALPIACITKGQKGEELTEFGDILASGAIAFSDDGLPVRDASIMRLALEYSRNFDCLIISHAEEMSLSKGGAMNEGRMSTILGLKGIPSACEDIAVYRDIRLAELTGARLHIAHVSTKEAVRLIMEAKQRGVRVTCETAPHYFSLTEDAVDGYNTLSKMNPPLRTEEDREAIIEGLKDGIIDCIATDHAPHSILEKECEFERAMNGIIGFETAVPLGLELVRQGILDELSLIHLFTKGPASVIGIEPEPVKAGSMAEFTVIDPEREFIPTKETLFSKSHNTPFLNKKLRGRPVLTAYNGKIVFKLK